MANWGRRETAKWNNEVVRYQFRQIGEELWMERPRLIQFYLEILQNFSRIYIRIQPTNERQMDLRCVGR